MAVSSMPLQNSANRAQLGCPPPALRSAACRCRFSVNTELFSLNSELWKLALQP